MRESFLTEDAVYRALRKRDRRRSVRSVATVICLFFLVVCAVIGRALVEAHQQNLDQQNHADRQRMMKQKYGQPDDSDMAAMVKSQRDKDLNETYQQDGADSARTSPAPWHDRWGNPAPPANNDPPAPSPGKSKKR